MELLHTDICDSWCDADFHPRISLFCQLALKELVQLGVENSIGDKFPTFGDSASLSRGHDCWLSGWYLSRKVVDRPLKMLCDFKVGFRVVCIYLAYRRELMSKVKRAKIEP